MGRTSWTASLVATAFVVAASTAFGQRAPAAPVPSRDSAAARSEVLAYVGARVFTGTGAPLEEATVVVSGGKVVAVGKGVVPPAGAEVRASKGVVITPGFVDPLTSVGIREVDLESATGDDNLNGHDPLRAAFRAADGFNPASTLIAVTRIEGVTSVGVVPVGGIISGQSAWIDLDGDTASDAIAASPMALHVRVGVAAESSGGHAGAVLRVREAFEDARVFQRTKGAWERNQSRPFAPSRLDLEALSQALGRKLPVVFHVDRAADILSVLALARELNLRPIVAGGAEAWKVTHALATAKVPVIVYPLLAGPETFDALGARDDNAARLHAAGVPLMLSTGDGHNVRKLRQAAGNAVRAGLGHEAAIEAVTRAAAEAFGLESRYGSIAAGRVANLVVWNGDPLEIATHAVEVVIRGRRVDLRSRQTLLFEKYRGK